MKNYHLLAAVALIAMAGCSQNEITDVSPDANPVVGFDIYTGGQTKGVITDTDGTGGGTGIQTTGFGILAYYTGQDAWTSKIGSTTPNFMWNQKVTYGEAWTYTPVKYWPNTKEAKTSFFAYAPYSSNGTSDKGIKLPTNTTTTKPTIEFTLASDPTEMVDLVAGFQKDQEKRSESVTFDFKHLLSRVEFTAKLGVSLASTSETHVYITGMSILGTADDDTAPTLNDQPGENSRSKFYSKAVYDWSAGLWEYESVTEQDVAYSIDNLLNLTSHSSNIAGYGTQAIEINQDGTTATSLFKSNEYLFLIPPRDHATETDDQGIGNDGDVRVLVKYDIVTKDAGVQNGFTIAKTWATVSLNRGTLKRGIAYKYNLTIDLQKVVVDVNEVVSWDIPSETLIPSVDANPTNDAGIGNAITALNAIKAQNSNCNYFVVNIADAGTGSYSFTATTGNFKPGDKIELKFTSGTPSGATLSGWAVEVKSSSVILTRNKD